MKRATVATVNEVIAHLTNKAINGEIKAAQWLERRNINYLNYQVTDLTCK